MARKQDLKWFREWQFGVSFMHLELRRAHEEGDMKVGESKAGIRLQDS